MLYNQNLDKIVFTKNQTTVCDELIVISGYVGPSPVRKLGTLPIKTTVIYGMYGCDGIRKRLHDSLIEADRTFENVNILYSSMPVHAKCYIWRYKGDIRSALIGSANFSQNGLNTPYKEVLADATVDTFDPLNQYIDMIREKAIHCKDAAVKVKESLDESTQKKIVDVKKTEEQVCSMPLYIIKDGKKVVPSKSGLNWGLAKLTGAHVSIWDAYIPICKENLDDYPELFPQKQEFPAKDGKFKKNHRHNDSIEIIWDDGTLMTALLEGSVTKNINGEKCLYPKQISSTPSKSALGKYLRKRLNVGEGYQITYEDLLAYGRTDISVSLLSEGIYSFDFSV